MATQLTYALSTTPGPLTAGLDNAIITITATNNSESVVSLQGLSIGVSTGTGANNLTNNPGQMNAVTPVGWKEDKLNQTKGSYTLVFTPKSSPVQVPPHESLVFTISNIQLNNMAGASDIVITEGTAGTPSQALSVSVFPGGWGNIVFSVAPTYLTRAGNVELTWNGPSGATYQLQYTDLATGITTSIAGTFNNYGTYPGQRQPSFTISVTTVFTLTVTAVIDGTTVTATPQVTVPVAEQAPLISSFTATLTDTTPPQLALNWTTENAISVKGSWTSNLLSANPSSATLLSPPFSKSYQIIATNGGGVTSAPHLINLTKWANLLPQSLGSVSGSFSVASITPNGQYALVANTHNSVLVLNMNNLSAQTIPVGNNSVAIAITPDGNHALVANFDSSTVSVIDINNLSATPQSISVGNKPFAITFTPNGNYALVTNIGSNTVSVIDMSNLSATPQTISVGVNPGAIAITPNGNYVFVANFDSGTVSVIDINNLSATPQSISVGFKPFAIAITPNGNYALVTNYESNTVSVIDMSNLSATPQTISVGNYPGAIAITPNGNYALVTNYLSNTVSVIDINNLSATPQSISVGADPNCIAITPNGNYVFVANPVSNTVSVIDMSNLSATPKTISVGVNPNTIAISPDGNYAFVGNSVMGTVSVIDINNLDTPILQTIALNKSDPSGAISIFLLTFSNYVLVSVDWADEYTGLYLIGLTP